MSLLYKIIAPLLDKELKKEDLDQNIGFVGMYGKDKNRPWLDNHFFLIYDIGKNPTENYKRECRFEKHTNIYDSSIQQINGKYYKIYVYPILNKDIKETLETGEKPRHIENINRILLFWLGHDLEVSNFILANAPKRASRVGECVPEYDYTPETCFFMAYEKREMY
jgi:hypothetical protein